MLLQDTQKIYLRSLIDNAGLKTKLRDRNTTKATPLSVDQVHKKYVAFYMIRKFSLYSQQHTSGSCTESKQDS